MASSYEKLKEMNLNRDEVERLTDALKDKNFRKMLTDYVEEVQDPENKKKFQEEMTQFEKERGVDVTFINPIAGYVIKTSVNGNEKAFINICANENVSKPTSTVAVVDGAQGRHWSIPHTIAPPRHDYDKKKTKCQVFDVVFHPETLHLAHKFNAFRDVVNKTACDAIESHFDVILDRKNLKFPKLQYKGLAHAAIIRKPSKDPLPQWTAEEKAVMDEFYAKIDAENPPPPKTVPKSPKKNKAAEDSTTPYTTPKYIIKHCRHIEMEEFTEHKTAKMNTATPKELIVEVELPLLRSSSDISLDVTEKTLQLTSEKPAKYNLFITLPYQVNHDCGNAKFVKDKKKLVVTLPVIVKSYKFIPDVSKDDSGVESDPGSNISTSPDDFERKSIQVISENMDPVPVKVSIPPIDVSKFTPTFLDPILHYSLPEFITDLYDNILSFTLNVKNVDNTSITKNICDLSSIHLKFVSISSGFYPTHYALFLKFPNHTFDKDKIVIEAWDNNVIVQISLNASEEVLHLYYYGVDASNTSEKYLSEASVVREKNENEVEPVEEKEREAEIKEEPIESRAINIASSPSESSSDNLSCSYSPSKSKGILKCFRKPQRFGRSISESGLDEVAWASSIENFASVDSIIPEEEEISSSLKKTVRFSNVVSRNLFRSNSSILGQKKKKYKKAKSKKRARDRRHSEGEVVDTEVDSSERDCETAKESNSEIFQLEIN
ncbi:hypothetical protein FQR65_LT06727 [Abscondita terminalis]|nr:hypothetical protein FQR65_LT06727 [Abscondita terminalis]